MSTVNDVAKLAKVSAMTVSRALNNPEKVSPKSLKRVEAAIAELGYRPNQAARALATNSTGIVKLVVPERLGTSDPYFTTLFAGVASILSKNHLAVLFEEDLTSNIKYDGLIVMGLNEQSDLSFLDYPAPVVVFGKGDDYQQTGQSVDWIDLNNEEASYIATKHLIGLGHTEIALFKFDADEPFLDEREVGYHLAMAEHGIKVRPEWVVSGIEHTSYGAKMQTMRTLRTTSVTGIVCTSDLLGIGVIQAARDLGIRIPDDLSVVGFDGVGYDQMADPRLTTMSQPVHWIGQRLGQLLLERIQHKGEPLPPKHELISAELVVRDSTARRK
ncbi:LacI family DNA-binding transcriptional regulator [Reinekea marinisedimentorum]|uniref:DNA-binding LacI/PurR family transcriptional regulator n=1 Tax=Reinekea marinisedimentorum TaxID=230495 RepID=A0A4R3HRE4_9GAMM|nr:LacI family DNA-binding transcriptional regulator [Reinekea marinisedimentorum]TCS35677.1 DNA-binding LacI/PurR family transcriptional regulator [Reinekea marinisedimentorum]